MMAASNVQSTVRKSMQLRSSMLPSNSSKRNPTFHWAKSDVDEVTSSLYRAIIDDHKVFLLCSCRLLCCCWIVVVFVVVLSVGCCVGVMKNNESRRRFGSGQNGGSPLVTDQMESSLALHFFDFADVAPKNGDFGERSPR